MQTSTQDQPAAFLGRLQPGERECLHDAGTRHSFCRGANLMLQHDAERSVAVLLRGRTKVVRSGRDRDVLLGISDPGEVFGELAYFGRSTRVASVTALDDGEALVVGPTGMSRVLNSHPRLADVLLQVVACRCRGEILQRVARSSSDTLGRLAARLVELADRYGEPVEDGVLVASPLTQADLAAWVGSSRTGVAEGLRKLRRLGWVRTSPGEVLITGMDCLRARAS